MLVLFKDKYLKFRGQYIMPFKKCMALIMCYGIINLRPLKNLNMHIRCFEY